MLGLVHKGRLNLRSAIKTWVTVGSISSDIGPGHSFRVIGGVPEVSGS